MDAGESYKNFRKMGMSKDFARHLAMKGGWEEELEGVRTGVNLYSPEVVRMATAHMRQDLVLVVSDLGEILKEQRRTNRRLTLLIAVVIFAAAAIAQG